MAVSDITSGTTSGAPVLEPSPRALLRRRIFGHAGLVIGAFVLISIVLMALLAPYIAPHDPLDQVLDRKLIPPIWFDSEPAEYRSSARPFATRLQPESRASSSS